MNLNQKNPHVERLHCVFCSIRSWQSDPQIKPNTRTLRYDGYSKLKNRLTSIVGIVLVSISVHSVNAENNANALPNQLGQYHVGYTEFHACDDSRITLVSDNPIFHGGSLTDCARGFAVQGKIKAARPVGFRVWYPTNATTGEIVRYSFNSDLYPNTGAMATALTKPSPNGARWDVPVAQQPSGFPLIIFSPGSSSVGTEYADAFNELLASHGFVLVGLDHANDAYIGIVGNDTLGLYTYPENGPYPFAGGGNEAELIFRINDVKFAINEMLRRNQSDTTLRNTINPHKIGLQSYSFGGPTNLGVTAGIASLGITADPRIKAILMMDGTLYGVPGRESAYTFNLHATTSRDLLNIKIPMLLMHNASTPDDLRAFQDVGSKDVTMVMLSTGAHISTALRYCAGLENILANLGTVTLLDTFPAQNINFSGSNWDWYQHYLPNLVDMQGVVDAETILFNNPLASNIKNLRGFADNPSQHCSSSLFANRSIADAKALLFADPALGVPPPMLGLNIKTGFTPSIYTMPIQMLDDELMNAAGFYSVAFFEAKLADNKSYNNYLTPEYAKENFPSFIKTWHNRFEVVDHPLDLTSGDKITFKPINNDTFEVSFSRSNNMVPVDSRDIILDIHDTVSMNQDIIPFQAGFPFLGTSFGNSTINSPFLTDFYGVDTSINNINVYNVGTLTFGLDRPLNVLSDIGMPFHTDDALIGSGVYRIAPFFTHLVANKSNSKVRYKETSDHRLIVTWSNMDRYPFELDNLHLGNVVKTGTSTFQVVLYGNGSSNPGQIEFIYGKIDAKTNSPDRIIAVVGIAKGNAWTNYPIESVGTKMGTPVDYTTLQQHPIILPVGAIYESFTRGIVIDKE
ncbi:MAG: hypothetical protein M3R00_04120 [Pseudomonadota bacterium]|nr:hypothetical protein [Pseudomonadota bacterium]